MLTKEQADKLLRLSGRVADAAVRDDGLHKELCQEHQAFAAYLDSLTTESPHPDDQAVDRFAARMKWKLAQARKRGKSGWQDRSWTPEQISEALREHVEKGDPTDVANYCMFLAARCEPIAPLTAEQPQAEPVADMLWDAANREELFATDAQGLAEAVAAWALSDGESRVISVERARRLPDRLMRVTQAPDAGGTSRVLWEWVDEPKYEPPADDGLLHDRIHNNGAARAAKSVKVTDAATVVRYVVRYAEQHAQAQGGAAFVLPAGERVVAYGRPDEVRRILPKEQGNG